MFGTDMLHYNPCWRNFSWSCMKTRSKLMSSVTSLRAQAFGILIVWSQKRTKKAIRITSGETNSQQHAANKSLQATATAPSVLTRP